MLYPQTIIELDTYFSEETKKRFLKLMNENFDIDRDFRPMFPLVSQISFHLFH